jgi:type II secretory pathway pseudopilin PulG
MMKNNKGFSLIEIMVGITIVIAASTIVLSIIISSFRISSKTTSTSVIRQNGNYALSQATRKLQFADSFISATCGGIPVTSCPASGVACTRVDFMYNSLPSSVACLGNDFRIGGSTSMDTSKITGTSCSLICSQSSGEAPVIGINFGLAIGNAATAVERKSAIDFSTSVKMRNL